MDINKFSLNAGELSDELYGRVDLSKVQTGLSVAENVRVLRVGGVTRRAGLEYLTTAFNEAEKSRLEGFRFAEDQGFCLEFSDNKMRVFQDGELVIDPLIPLTVLERTTPWDETQIFALQFAQRVDGIVVSHPETPLQLITRNVADGNWTVQEFPWTQRVWETITTNAIISLNAAAVTGNTTITATSAIFAADWVGTRIRLGHVRPEQPTIKTIGDVVSAVPTVNLATTSYAVGDVIRQTVATRLSGKYAGVIPVGTLSYWTVIAAYDFSVDYTGSASPDDYPTFFEQGAVAVPTQEVRDGWTFETFGTFIATYVIERRYDAGTWASVKIAQSDADKNFLVQDSEEAEANAEFRVLILDTTTGSYNERFSFVTLSHRVFGYGIVTAFNSTTEVDVTVESDFESTDQTTDWYEDAFNPKNGYPVTCTYHQKRLFLGGSVARPQTVWSSRVRQPFDFTSGVLADDGLVFETEAKEYESVLWLCSHLSLLVGTTSGIWAINSPNGLSLTSENNNITKQVRMGAYDGIPAILLQNNVIYLQTKGRKVHELTGGSVEYGGYTDVDLTQLASHITRGGVTQITTGEVPDSVLYVVSGGQLAVLTYERAQNVVGWARWVTDGVIESVGVCAGGNEDDDVYVSVLRGANRYIERLTPDMLRVEENLDMVNLAFLDSYVRKIDAVAFTVFDGLGHLEGREVGVFADGELQGNFTVSGGSVTLPHEVFNAVAGLNYDSIVTTMPVDQGSIGVKMIIQKAYIRFRNSLGMQARQGSGGYSKVSIDLPVVPDGGVLPLLSGDAEVTIHSSWARSTTITIKQSDPLPMTILATRIVTKNT